MSLSPTGEQQHIIVAYTGGADLTIEAGAGTGKTSTLKMLAAATPARRGVYLAYNKAIQLDAAKSFPRSVVCKTAHAYAFAAVARPYAHRLNAPRVPAWRTAEILGIRQPVALPGLKAPLGPQQLARIVSATVDRFCHTADVEITRWHVPRINGVDRAAHAELAKVIEPWARKAWADINSTTGQLRFTHDAYLKIWQLTQPLLGADYVLFDEAQDADPCVADIVERQQAQRILVGDRCQAIYGWRGAIDAMAGFTGQRLYLSQSFRFGQAIADEANKWLTVVGARLRLTGHDSLRSTLAPLPAPQAILCRSNAGAFTRVVDSLAAGRRTALVGGSGDIKRMAEAAAKLQSGQPCDHPELLAFSSWAEVQDYAENDTAGSDLKVFVTLVDQLGADEIVKVCDRLVDERYAQTVVSTAHKAKGREWTTVQINTDFREPALDPDTGQRPDIPREDAMLAYVSVTRARQTLDRSGLAWIDEYVTPAPKPAPTAAEVSRTLVLAAQELIGPQPTFAEFMAPMPLTEQQPAAQTSSWCLHGDRCMLCNPAARENWPAPLPVGAP